MAQVKVEFKGIHNSLRIAVQQMETIFLFENFNSVDEHIAAVNEAMMLAEATINYVRDNKPRAEKNPEGLADKLAQQMDKAEDLLAFLEAWQVLIENDELLDYANSDEEPFEERIAALTKILDVTQDSYIENVNEINIDQANHLALQRNQAKHLIDNLSIEEAHTLKALQEENDALLAKLEQERLRLIVDEFDNLSPDLDEDSFSFAEIDKIDFALTMLQNKTETIGNTFEGARQVAHVLNDDLLTARNQYQASLISGKATDGEKVSSAEARHIFKATCSSLIMEAMPILEKDDLSWGDFLKNLLKTIINALITVGTAFTVHNFFKPVQSTKEIVTEAEKELLSVCDTQPAF